MGAFPGPDIDATVLCYGGLCHHYLSSPANSASTTVCQINTPAATTTIIALGHSFNAAIATSTAAQNDYLMMIATSSVASPAATSSTNTLSGPRILQNASADQFSMYGTSTAPGATTGGTNNSLLYPNSRIKWTVSGNDVAPSPRGGCFADLLEIQ